MSNVISTAISNLRSYYSIDGHSEKAFYQICEYLIENPDRLSWRGTSPLLSTTNGIELIGHKYFKCLYRIETPAIPSTVPDDMVSIIMMTAYGYTEDEAKKIKLTHQQSMCAENMVGALLERYLNSVLKPNGWCWCCGDFVKAIDFIKKHKNGEWYELQIKNRDNSENSSSSAIRKNTKIEKWFRTFSKTGATNWGNLPTLMQGFDLSEKGFVAFVKKYLRQGLEE